MFNHRDSNYEGMGKNQPKRDDLNPHNLNSHDLNSHNLFERRIIYVPVNRDKFTFEEEAQTPQQAIAETDSQPDFYASLPQLGEHANFATPYADSADGEPTDLRFQLQPDPATEERHYLMLRPASAPTRWPAQQTQKARSHSSPSWRGGRILTVFFISLLLILGGGGLYYHFMGSPSATNSSFAGAVAITTPAPTPIQPSISEENGVIARAVVKPLRNAALEMSSSGTLVKIFVKEGDLVKADTPLLQLDDTLQKLALQEASATLAQAEARLAATRAGSRPEEIAAAQAAVDAAKARLLASSEAGVRETDVTSAQAQLASAQAQLQDLLNGPKEATLIDGRTTLQNAEAAVQQARSAYNQVSWRNDIGMLPESLALQKATNEYNAALARYNLIAQPATAAQISEARARVEEARASLIRTQTPAKPADLQAIEAEVRKAEADLQLLQLGSRPEEIARAEAEVQAAEVTVLRAQTLLSQTVLLAPFSGLVGDIAIELGEQVTAGKVLIQFGDTSGWRIETSDLTELDITKVQQGAPAIVQIDALPGEILAGTVSHIKRWGEDKVGDIVYTVEILPQQFDKRLRWNMTAAVTIQTIGDGINPPQNTGR